jgi:probable rRNA maturation factor
MGRITVDSVAGRPSADPGGIEAMLEGRIDGEVEIVLADPGYMRVVNRRFRHIDRPTDVITFDMSEGPSPEGVIYVDCRLAPPLEDLLERIFHGWLHLCGWTHDTEEDSALMAAEVGRLVASCMEEGGR